MTRIRRLTDSCVVVETDRHSTLIDPGFHPFDHFDLEEVGDVDRVLITHEHADHVDPRFVRWLIDRRNDLTVFSNSRVAEILAREGIEVSGEPPDGVSFEEALHEPIPTGDQPPNLSLTVEGVFTHPGDSHRPTVTAPVLALPLLAPWTSTTAAVAFARRLQPRQVIPIHDFLLGPDGRDFIVGMAKRVLARDGIELVPLGWGEGYTL
jgi:L-ascorbate metabolism protein UlaG (beta-lactamase superfamily)